MWRILHGSASNDLYISFHFRPRTGWEAVVPPLWCFYLPPEFIRQLVCCYGSEALELSFSLLKRDYCREFESFNTQLSSLLLRIPDQAPMKGYSCPNNNSLLDWKNDQSTLELWGGRDCWWPCCSALNLTKVMLKEHSTLTSGGRKISTVADSLPWKRKTGFLSGRSRRFLPVWLFPAL
jgi:hypothetical protein